MTEISYQLYCSRNFPDLERQAKMVAGIGYRNVEPFGGLFGDVPRLRAALDANGLHAPSAHIGAPSLREDFAGAVAKIKQLGVTLMIVPAVPPDERVNDLAGWKKLGAELTGWARQAADHGIGFAWHNHDFELKAPARRLPAPRHVLGDDAALKWQMDLAWLIRGGEDPAAWMHRYAPRIVSFHVKDLARPGEHADEDGWADVGHGTLQWDALLPAMRATPATLYVVEHDNPSDDARFARRAYATVSAW